MDELRRRVGGQKENGNGRKFNELEEARRKKKGAEGTWKRPRSSLDFFHFGVTLLKRRKEGVEL
ncbi:hypothetical protein QR685DRAFT_595339 [Neurospora intermedia]|uniref:Uncharacterized protein n=1 Tax=Neurospora intermedia TaxID=5142 RepID=A0ABR3DLV4_NEUIN